MRIYRSSAPDAQSPTVWKNFDGCTTLIMLSTCEPKHYIGYTNLRLGFPARSMWPRMDIYSVWSLTEGKGGLNDPSVHSAYNPSAWYIPTMLGVNGGRSTPIPTFQQQQAQQRWTTAEKRILLWLWMGGTVLLLRWLLLMTKNLKFHRDEIAGFAIGAVIGTVRCYCLFRT